MITTIEWIIIVKNCFWFAFKNKNNYLEIILIVYKRSDSAQWKLTSIAILISVK